MWSSLLWERILFGWLVEKAGREMKVSLSLPVQCVQLAVKLKWKRTPETLQNPHYDPSYAEAEILYAGKEERVEVKNKSYGTTF